MSSAAVAIVSTVVPSATNARISTRSSTRVSAFLNVQRDETEQTEREQRKRDRRDAQHAEQRGASKRSQRRAKREHQSISASTRGASAESKTSSP